MTGPRRKADERATRKHIIAVEKAIRAAAGQLSDTDAPLLEALRVMARQMDAAGNDPSTRLTAAYLSAQRDFQRVIATTRAAGPKRNPYDELKARREQAGA